MAPHWNGEVGAPEINSIWCPGDGWIPPRRHGVYGFREEGGFFVIEGGGGGVRVCENAQK